MLYLWNGPLHASRKGITILGGGHAGRGLAGYLGLKGFDVSLYNRTWKNIAAIHRHGGLDVRGIAEGFAPMSIVTDDMRTAVRGRDILIVVVPAHAHRFYAKTLAPHLRAGQTVLLMPGRTGGALEFAHLIRDHINPSRILLGEAQTFSFVSRTIDSSSVMISAVKNRVQVAAFPASRTASLLKKLACLPLRFSEAQSVLETSLYNIGAMLHPAPTILCAGLLESQRGGYNHYQDAISPSVGRLIEKMDAERRRVAEGFGVKTKSILDWLRRSYDAVGDTIRDCIRSIDAYDGVGSPETLHHRYVMEDVPTGLVPISCFGDMVGVNTAAIDAVINMACHLYDNDFWKRGRTLEKVGLAGMTPDEVIRCVLTEGLHEVETPSGTVWYMDTMEVQEQ